MTDTPEKTIYIIPNSTPNPSRKSIFGKIGNLATTPQRSQFTGTISTGVTTLGMLAGAIAVPPVGIAGITYISMSTLLASAFMVSSTIGRIDPRNEENEPKFIPYDKKVGLRLKDGRRVQFKVSELLKKAARDGSFNEEGIYTVHLESPRFKLQFELNKDAAIKLHLDPEVVDMLAPFHIQRNMDVSDGATTAIEQVSVQSLERFTILPFSPSHREPDPTPSEIMRELTEHNLERRSDIDIKLAIDSANEVLGIDVSFTGEEGGCLRLTKEGIDEIKMLCEQEGVAHKYVEIPNSNEASEKIYLRVNPTQLEATIAHSRQEQSSSVITQLNDGARIPSAAQVQAKKEAKALSQQGDNGRRYIPMRR